MFYLFGDPYVMYDFPHKRHLPGPVHQDLILKHIETHGFGDPPIFDEPPYQKGLKVQASIWINTAIVLHEIHIPGGKQPCQADTSGNDLSIRLRIPPLCGIL